MDDAISRYRAASETNDLDALIATLAPDAELPSPLSGTAVFRGPADIGILLGIVYSTVRELRWREEFGDDAARVVIGDCRIGPLRLSDAMVLDLAEDGRVRRIRPHLRPWLATTVFAVLVGPRVARHPRLVWRALRRAAPS